MEGKSLSSATLQDAITEIQKIRVEIKALEEEYHYWRGIVDFLKDQEFQKQKEKISGNTPKTVD